jgi:hypothetical protein
MNDTNTIIQKLFSERWTKNLSKAPIEDMRQQLYENLQNQVDGYWSGHTAYGIMVDGGFLIDSKRIRIKDTGMAKGKILTVLGEMFMESMK